MRRIVIDTSVFVAALRSRRGASYRLVEMAGDAPWQMHISVALAPEYEAVGRREAYKPGIPYSAIDDIAFAARCDFIVTHNVRHLRAAQGFGIAVATPGQFFRTMGLHP